MRTSTCLLRPGCAFLSITTPRATRTRCFIALASMNSSGGWASGGDVSVENALPEHKLVFGGDLGGTQTTWDPRFGNFGIAPPLPWQLQVHRLTHGHPTLRAGGKGREFNDWWNQPVIRDTDRREFSLGPDSSRFKSGWRRTR